MRDGARSAGQVLPCRAKCAFCRSERGKLTAATMSGKTVYKSVPWMRYARVLPKVPGAKEGVPAVGELGELVREWPGLQERNACADKALEAVFESLGRACVHRLVTA